MAASRFRVKFEHDPRSFCRDIVIGDDRSLVEFQRAITVAVGVDQDHLWFFGMDQDDWDRDMQYP